MENSTNNHFYKNPIISISTMDHGDPAVLRYNGRYYLYHTGNTEIPVYHSMDLVNWEPCGVALYASTEKDHWAQLQLWAPEVLYHNGTFYMYVTGARKKEDGTADDEIRRIGVATSHSPIGPFRLAPTPLTDEWSIDGHPFRDEDGTYYMYYNVRNKDTRGPKGIIGTGNVVDRMDDLETLSGKPSIVVKPEFPWEGNKEQSFFWNEGPFVVKRKGTYYQMYSAGFFGDETYGLYYATSSVPLGTKGTNDTGWTKWQGGRSILQSNDFCLGPGHHVVIRGPNGLDQYIIYHGYLVNDGEHKRRVWLDRFNWEDEKIVLKEPSTDKLPIPQSPTFDGRLISNLDDLNHGLSKIQESTMYHFETNFCCQEGATQLGGDVCYIDDFNYLRWEVDKVLNTFTVKINVEGCFKQHTKLNLLPSFQFNAFHQIIIKNDNGRFSFYLDDAQVAECDMQPLSSQMERGKIRLFGDHKATHFEGTIVSILK
jgi:GH43 family beta-xylosidase